MNQIRKTREDFKLSQADLYRALNWRQSRLANYEASSRTPSLQDARAIVAALNLLGATCSLESVFPEKLGLEAAVTMNTTLHILAGRQQSIDHSVRLSSVEGGQ